MRRSTLATLLLPLLLVGLLFGATACGESQDDKDQKKAIGNIAKTMEGEGNQAAYSKDYAKCFAETLVEGAGVKNLQDDKILKKNLKVNKDPSTADKKNKLSGDTAKAYADAQVDCLDWDDVGDAMKKDKQTKVDDSKIDAYVACIKKIDKKDLKESIRKESTGKADEKLQTKLTTAASACQQKLG